MVSGDLAASEARLDDAERALAAVPDGQAPPWADTEELRTLPATIAIYRASLAQARGDAAGTAEHARRALDLAGPDDHLARGGAAGFLGLAAWANGDVTERAGDLHAGGGEPARGRQPRRRAEQHGHARRHVARGGPTEQGTPAVPGCTAAWRGTRPTAWPVQPPTCTWGSARSTSKPETSQSARRQLEIAAAIGDRSPLNERRYRWFVAMGRTRRRRGRPRGGRRPPGPGGAAVPANLPSRCATRSPAMKARIRIAQGKLSQAADWARDRGVSATDDVSYLREFDHLTLVRLLLAQHRADPDTGAARPGGRAVGQAARRRRGIGPRRKSPGDPHAAGPGARRAGTSTAGPASPWPKPGRWHPNPTGTSGSSWTRAPP